MTIIEQNIRAAISGAYGNISFSSVGSVYDEDHRVILCPVCNCKCLDNHAICQSCGWEYDGFPDDHYSAANGSTLEEYRSEYFKLLELIRKDKI